MRYSLRTLVALLLVLPPLGAWGWREYIAYRERMERAKSTRTWSTLGIQVRPGGPPENRDRLIVDKSGK